MTNHTLFTLPIVITNVGMETTILLTTINRIGRLMQVGFGEAGKVMIAGQLKSSSTGESGQLNFMGAGHQIQSIFGFADVRQFTDTTECLQVLFLPQPIISVHDFKIIPTLPFKSYHSHTYLSLPFIFAGGSDVICQSHCLHLARHCCAV